MTWWTDEEFEVARRMWNEGKSASKIGSVIGKTRSAVLGKLHREDMLTKNSDRPKLDRPNIPKPEKIRPVISLDEIRHIHDISNNSSFVKKFNRASELNGHNVFIHQLTSQNCHWPMGMYKEPSIMFCGAPTNGHVYCNFHHVISMRKWP